MKIIAMEFDSYTINWWEQVCNTRRRHDQNQVSSWHEMKKVMRKWFFPTYYGRELHQKLRRLTQGSKSVAEYHQEMDNLMIKADVVIDEEATMARFQGGMNRDIQDRLEMQEFESIEEMLHKASLIEKQHKRKGISRNQFGSSKNTFTRDDKAFNKSKEEGSNTAPVKDDKLKGPVTAKKSRKIKDLDTMLMNVPTRRLC